jgi:hypothetical protein
MVIIIFACKLILDTEETIGELVLPLSRLKFYVVNNYSGAANMHEMNVVTPHSVEIAVVVSNINSNIAVVVATLSTAHQPL